MNWSSVLKLQILLVPGNENVKGAESTNRVMKVVRYAGTVLIASLVMLCLISSFSRGNASGLRSVFLSSSVNRESKSLPIMKFE